MAWLPLYCAASLALGVFTFRIIGYRAYPVPRPVVPSPVHRAPDPQLPSAALLRTPFSETLSPLHSLTPQLSLLQRLKCATVATLLGIPRLTVSFSALCVAVIVASLSAVGLPKNAAEFLWWQRALRVVLAAVARVWFIGAGFWPGCITVRGRRASREEASIAVCNHTGIMDGLLLGGHFLYAVVSKVENFHIPLLGAVIRGLRCIPVDRSDPKSREKTGRAIRQRAEEAHLWPQLLLFPEGTTSNSQQLLTFQRGAFIAGKPVQPLIIRHPHTFCDPSYVDCGPGMFNCLVRIFTQITNRVVVEFLPVYTPSAEEVADSVLYARNVQQYMAKAMNVPCSMVSQEDHLMAAKGDRFYRFNGHCVIGFSQLRAACSVSTRLGVHLVESFALADVTRRGTLTVEEFTYSMARPVMGRPFPPYPAQPQVATTMFDLFTLGASHMTLRQFMLASLVMLERGAGRRQETQTLVLKVLGSRSADFSDEYVLSCEALEAAVGPTSLIALGGTVTLPQWLEATAAQPEEWSRVCKIVLCIG